MAVTTLDPNTALIIVDLQKGIVGSSFIDPIDGIVSRSYAWRASMVSTSPYPSTP